MSETYYGLKKENAHDHSPSQKVKGKIILSVCNSELVLLLSAAIFLTGTDVLEREVTEALLQALLHP